MTSNTNTAVTKMVFTVYLNENGKAVAAGSVSAPDYETAKALVVSKGYDEKDFMLIKIEG
jgi:hypothetical protein